ncbi:MAG TPA: DUF131 domain-containing protein [Nitrososphaerales archaeon]|nr:DUF131 domain-containing protein [Nitrososphaerales archaeon]
MNPRLIWVGLALIFLGSLVVIVSASGPGSSASVGGFVLIGPIPIVYGSGPDSGILAAVAVAISLAVLVLYVASFLFWWGGRGRRTEPESD